MGMNIEAVKKETVDEQMYLANVRETARLASNYTIEEQIAVASVLDEEVLRNELENRRREEKNDLNAMCKVALSRIDRIHKRKAAIF